MHEHVSTVAIAEFLLSVYFARLTVVVLGGGGVGALPPAAVVHVGAVLSDGVRAALALLGIDARHGVAGPAGEWQLQAVHPAVG